MTTYFIIDIYDGICIIGIGRYFLIKANEDTENNYKNKLRADIIIPGIFVQDTSMALDIYSKNL